MLIIATFKHSAYLELALKLLQQTGVSDSHLLVAPLIHHHDSDPMSEVRGVHQNGKSPFDLAFIFATICMLLGAIYGFILPLGPILWAIIGIVVGAGIGLFIDRLIQKKTPPNATDEGAEVVVLVHCAAGETSHIEDILWKHQAIGLSKVPSYAE